MKKSRKPKNELKFEYWKSRDKQWRWHLFAANGEIIASGEGYKNKLDCLHAIGLIRRGKTMKKYSVELRQINKKKRKKDGQ